MGSGPSLPLGFFFPLPLSSFSWTDITVYGTSLARSAMQPYLVIVVELQALARMDL